MVDIIVQTSQNVTLVGAGVASKGQLADALAIAPYLVAADGGAKLALKYGIPPEYVIGDFDSVDKGILDKFPENRQIKITEQDTTDFEKCLSRIQAPLILGVGFLGGRLDHQLSALTLLARMPTKPCILIGEHDLVFRAPNHLNISLPVGTRVSLYPMANSRVDAQGLRWPINDAALSLPHLTSQSNEMKSDQLQLYSMGGLLVILPPDTLGAVVAALTVK